MLEKCMILENFKSNIYKSVVRPTNHDYYEGILCIYSHPHPWYLKMDFPSYELLPDYRLKKIQMIVFFQNMQNNNNLVLHTWEKVSIDYN